MTPEQCRAARGLLEWSQDHLAEMAQVSRQTVVDFERGERSPRDRSLKAMQDSFESNRVEFIPAGSYQGPGVRLHQSIWLFRPVNPESLNWKASTYCGDLIVRAPSERRGRQIADLALGIAVRRRAGQRVISNPWNRLVGETTCQRLIDSEYSEAGPDEILSPAEYDREWRPQFVSEAEGGPGVLSPVLRYRAFIPGDGLLIETTYADFLLDTPDNDFNLGFQVSEEALSDLAGRPIVGGSDARSVAQEQKHFLIGVMKKLLIRYQTSARGGRPLPITVKDLMKCREDATRN